MSELAMRVTASVARVPGIQLLVFLLLLPAAWPAQGSDAPIDRVRRLLRKTPLIDGHNDLAEQYRLRVKDHLGQIDLASDTSRLEPAMHTDIARLRAGGVGAQFWSVYVPADLPGAEAVQATLEQIDIVKRFTARYGDTLEMATTASEIERIHGKGKIASLIGMEGGHSIDNSLATLREMYRSGARYMTLTHWDNNDWADAATAPPAHHGLTKFGEEVIREMNRLGMLVDLSHVSEETMGKALDVSRSPVIFSHSSARALCGHPRNVPDTILRRLPSNGGVVMVNFSPEFVSEEVRQYHAAREAESARLKDLMPGDPEGAKKALEEWEAAHPKPKATLRQVADHIDHIRQVAGIEHVGLGSDFDGISSVPVGLEDVSRFPDLLAELIRRGYSDDDIRRVAGRNLLRVLRKAEEVASRMQKETEPSDTRIEEVSEKSPPPHS
jgi:membrane dipeptidase